jgi:thiosulfate reductase cytochrome b subunit
MVHVMAFFLLTAFLVVHVYLTTLGKTPLEHIRAMFTGYEETEEQNM